MEELKKQPMTAVLLVLNIVIFLLADFIGGTENVSHMLKWGAAYAPYILEEHEYYRLVTCMFLHFGMEHLANNMLVLFVLGGRVERTVGKISFLLIYFFGGIAGNIVSLILQSSSHAYAVSAGASGGVFALCGALLYLLLRNHGRVEDLSARQIVIAIALSVYLGFVGSGVDNAAHIGGLLGGFLGGILFYHPRNRRNAVP